MLATKGGGRDPGGGATALGALLLLVAGVALGLAYNAVGLASRPARGLAWISARGATGTLGSLESLEPPGTVAPAPVPAADAPPSVAWPAPAPEPAQHAPRRPRPPRAANATGPRETTAVGDAPAVAAAPRDSIPHASPPIAVMPPPPVVPDVTGPLTVDLPLLKRLYDAGRTLVVDARGPPEYEAGHIAGAVNVPYETVLAEPDRVKALDPQGRAIVVYCSGGRCELSKDLAHVLVEAGRRRVLVYEGGYPEWEAAGFPVERGTAGSRP